MRPFLENTISFFLLSPETCGMFPRHFFFSRNCLFVALLGGFMYHYSTRSLRICPSCSLNRESLPALPFSRSEVGFPYSTARVGESFFLCVVS